MINSHIIEITPVIEFSSNKELDTAWMDFAESFMRQYPSEDIVFISSDSSLAIKDPCYELNPSIASNLIGFEQINAFVTLLQHSVEIEAISTQFKTIWDASRVFGIDAFQKYFITKIRERQEPRVPCAPISHEPEDFTLAA